MPVKKPQLVKLNYALARELGLDIPALENDEGVLILSGNIVPEGAAPLAMAYAGHQYGHFVPQLGDGRALLLGEVIAQNGRRVDIQLKGSGPTPFSRGGDGRAALGPVLREYIMSEAMHALGVPTTRSLAVVTTGEPVFRENVLPGAVLTRIAASHLRIGTFEFFAQRQDIEGLKRLADYAINRHYPEANEGRDPYHALLECVAESQAKLVAHWMHVGFIHGVMNTDNTSISGETIDYGPCAFMDHYDPETVFSSIDRHGRYAFGRQPSIAKWNLARFAEALLPIVSGDRESVLNRAKEVIEGFSTRFERHWLSGMRQKLGLLNEKGDDLFLINSLLALMKNEKVDYTLTFRELCEIAAGGKGTPQALFPESDDFKKWLASWWERLQLQSNDLEKCIKTMRLANPTFIPRNHRVEQALRAATEHGDYSKAEELLTVLSKPFEDPVNFLTYSTPPKEEERVLETFCGT